MKTPADPEPWFTYSCLLAEWTQTPVVLAACPRVPSNSPLWAYTEEVSQEHEEKWNTDKIRCKDPVTKKIGIFVEMGIEESKYD